MLSVHWCFAGLGYKAPCDTTKRGHFARFAGEARRIFAPPSSRDCGWPHTISAAYQLTTAVADTAHNYRGATMGMRWGYNTNKLLCAWLGETADRVGLRPRASYPGQSASSSDFWVCARTPAIPWQPVYALLFMPGTSVLFSLFGAYSRTELLPACLYSNVVFIVFYCTVERNNTRMGNYVRKLCMASGLISWLFIWDQPLRLIAVLIFSLYTNYTPFCYWRAIYWRWVSSSTSGSCRRSQIYSRRFFNIFAWLHSWLL